MKYVVRYFIDGSERCLPWNSYEYQSTEAVIIPRQNDFVRLFKNEEEEYPALYMVLRVEYDMTNDDSDLSLIDVYVCSINEDEW